MFATTKHKKEIGFLLITREDKIKNENRNTLDGLVEYDVKFNNLYIGAI